MVADDEPRVLDVTCRLLEAGGWSVRAVADGQSLLQEIRAGAEVDVVVIDAIMPGLHGADVVRAVRELRPGVAIVTVSGYSPDQLGDHGSLMGADAFVQKPFTIGELLDGIGRARALARGQGSGAPSVTSPTL